MAEPRNFLALAHELADAARGETLLRWRGGVKAENKAQTGWDPVTEADREAERIMRDLIESNHGDHGSEGEEFPGRPARGPWTWSLDPVDGTRAFVCQLPTWVTLIGLLQKGTPVLGIIDAPCLGERYTGWGSEARLHRGGECETIRVSGCTVLADTRLSTTDPYMFQDAGMEAFAALRNKVRTTRYGFDGYAYARLAAGSLDLVIESGLKTYDYNALIPVVRAAGGVFGDWFGGDDFSRGDVIAAASPELYARAVEIMRSAA
ncbi:MAG: inositol monophosphatase family protein [Sphingomicrobium sp.]